MSPSLGPRLSLLPRLLLLLLLLERRKHGQVLVESVKEASLLQLLRAVQLVARIFSGVGYTASFLDAPFLLFVCVYLQGEGTAEKEGTDGQCEGDVCHPVKGNVVTPTPPHTRENCGDASRDFVFLRERKMKEHQRKKRKNTRLRPDSAGFVVEFLTTEGHTLHINVFVVL